MKNSLEYNGFDKKDALYLNLVNGNISTVKSAIKRMNKSEFFDFLEYCRGNGILPHTLRYLWE
jgi:hypothetical protein